MARGRRRARPLDRRPDRARGVRARLSDDLVRLGPRAHPREQRGVPALRDRRRREVGPRAPRGAAPGARGAARAGARRSRRCRLRRRSCSPCSRDRRGLARAYRSRLIPTGWPARSACRAGSPDVRGRAHVRRRAARAGNAGRARRARPPQVRARRSSSSASRSRKAPALARAIVAAGHEVALHGYRHTLLLRRRVARVRRRPRPRVGGDRRGDRRRADPLPAAVRRLQPGTLAHVRARGWSRCSGRPGAATGSGARLLRRSHAA